MSRTINMGAELYPLFAYFSQRSQGKHLKPAAVRQYGSVPVHKFMQASCLPDNVVTRSQVQMVCVGEDYVCSHFFNFFRAHGLDGSLCSHRHKYRRLYITMRCMNNASSCFGLCVFFKQVISYCMFHFCSSFFIL